MCFSRQNIKKYTRKRKKQTKRLGALGATVRAAIFGVTKTTLQIHFLKDDFGHFG